MREIVLWQLTDANKEDLGLRGRCRLVKAVASQASMRQDEQAEKNLAPAKNARSLAHFAESLGGEQAHRVRPDYKLYGSRMIEV